MSVLQLKNNHSTYLMFAETPLCGPLTTTGCRFSAAAMQQTEANVVPADDHALSLVPFPSMCHHHCVITVTYSSSAGGSRNRYLYILM